MLEWVTWYTNDIACIIKLPKMLARTFSCFLTRKYHVLNAYYQVGVMRARKQRQLCDLVVFVYSAVTSDSTVSEEWSRIVSKNCLNFIPCNVFITDSL